VALGSWFSQFWRAAGPTVAAVAAVATGNPELAIPASQAAAATIKPKKPAPPPAPVAAPTAIGPAPGGGGFLQAYQGLSQADKEVVVVGGAVLGSVVLYKALFGGRR
jgi:hypothetical protein